jgi:sugar (pentulose or hexulose) kinase
MSPDCVVGIDIGTTSVRVAVYDEDGNLITEGRVPNDISHPRPGWAEQDAEAWWQGVCTASLEAMGRFPYRQEAIKGIAITSMRQTFACLGKDLAPLRPAILWYDTRHARQVDRVREQLGSRRVYELTGSPPGRRAVYKLMWLKENEPECYENTAHVAFIPDLILLRLTGVLATTPGVSYASGCLSASNPLEWATSFIQTCNLDPEKWIRPILPPGAISGQVNREAASRTGFPEGAPVVMASGDQACGNLGSGVCQPGMLGINGGTSCALQTPSSKLPMDEAMSFFVDYSPAGYYVAENGITSGTAALTEWFRDGFAAPEAEASGDDEEVWDTLYNLAKEAPPGNLGLMLVPYLRGANGPLWNPRARGVLVGLMADHDRRHLMRALFEGLAYESRRILESMEAGTGVPIHSVRTYGGASHSDIWNQIFADILSRPVTVTQNPAPVSLGAAISAGYGVGIYPDPISAAERMVKIRKTYQPDPNSTRLYDKLYRDVYVHVYNRLGDLSDAIAHITTHTEDIIKAEIIG